MAEAVFRCFFPGRVRLFGKTNGHSRESLATNTAGKNALSQGRNKAELSARAGDAADKKQKLPHKKEPSHFLNGIPYGLANGGGSRFRSILWQGRAVRPAHTPQIKRKPPRQAGGLPFYADKKRNSPRQSGGVSFLCRWWGSNPHVLLAQGILSFREGFPFGVIW